MDSLMTQEPVLLAALRRCWTDALLSRFIEFHISFCPAYRHDVNAVDLSQIEEGANRMYFYQV